MGGEGRATFERRDSKYGFDVGDDALSSLPLHAPSATSSPISPYSETMRSVQMQHDDIMNDKPKSGRVSSLIVRYGTTSPPKRRPSQEVTDVHKAVASPLAGGRTISPPRRSANTEGRISSLIDRFEATTQEIIKNEEEQAFVQLKESEETELRGLHEEHSTVTTKSIAEDTTIADGPNTETSPHSTDSDLCTKVATSCLLSRFKATAKEIMDKEGDRQEGATMDQTSHGPAILTSESLSLVKTQNEQTLALTVKDNMQGTADADDQGPMQMILEDVVNGCANDESEFGVMMNAGEKPFLSGDNPKGKPPVALSKARDGFSLLDDSDHESFSDNSESAIGGSSKRRRMKIKHHARATAESNSLFKRPREEKVHFADDNSDHKLNHACSDVSEEVQDRYSSSQRRTRKTRLTMDNNIPSVKKKDEGEEVTAMEDEVIAFLKITPDSSTNSVSSAPKPVEVVEDEEDDNDDHRLIYATESGKVISQIKHHQELEPEKKEEEAEVIVHIRALEQHSDLESRCSQFSEVSYVTSKADHGAYNLHNEWDDESEQNRLGKREFGQGKGAASFKESELLTDWAPAAASEWGGSEMPGHGQSFDTTQKSLDWEVGESSEWEESLSPDAIRDNALANQQSYDLSDIAEDVAASPRDLPTTHSSPVDSQDPTTKINARIVELKSILGKLQNQRGEKESLATETRKAKRAKQEEISDMTKAVELIPSDPETKTEPLAVGTCKKIDPTAKEAFDRYDSLLDQLVRQNKALKRGVSASETSLGDNSDVVRVRVASIRMKRDRAIDAYDELLDSVLEREATPKRGDLTLQPANEDKFMESRDPQKRVRSRTRPTSFNPKLDAAYRAAEAIKARQIQDQLSNIDAPISPVAIEPKTVNRREASQRKIFGKKEQRQSRSTGRGAKLDNAFRVAEAVKARQLRDESPAAQSQPDSFKYYDRSASPTNYDLDISHSTESKQRSQGTPENQEHRRKSPGHRRKDRKERNAHHRDRSTTVSKSPRRNREERLSASVSPSPKRERGQGDKSQVKDTIDAPLRQQSHSHRGLPDHRRPTASFSLSPQRSRGMSRKDDVKEAINSSSRHRNHGRPTKFSSSLSPSRERSVMSSREYIEKETIQSPIPFLDQLESSRRDSPPDTVSIDYKRPISLDLPSMKYQPSSPRGVRDSPRSSGSDPTLELGYHPSPPSRRGARGPESPTPPLDRYQTLRYQPSPLSCPEASVSEALSVPDRYQELGSLDIQPTWPDRYQALRQVPSSLRGLSRDPVSEEPQDRRHHSSSPSQVRRREHAVDHREPPQRKVEPQKRQHGGCYHSSPGVRPQSVPRSYQQGDMRMQLSSFKEDRPQSAPRRIRHDEASPNNLSRYVSESAEHDRKHNKDVRNSVSSSRYVTRYHESEKTKLPSSERRRLLGEYSDQTRQLRRELDLARLMSLAIRNAQHSLSLELQAFKHKLTKHRDCKRGEIEILTACHVQLDSFQRRMKATKKTLNAPQHQQVQSKQRGGTKPRHHPEMRRQRDVRMEEAERGWEGFSEISSAMKSNLELMNHVRKSISKPYPLLKDEEDEDMKRLHEIQRLTTKLQVSE